MSTELAYWGDGEPQPIPTKTTTGMDYWGDGSPLADLYVAVFPEIMMTVGALTLTGLIPGAGEVIHRQFPIPPSNRSMQSQTGKRKFPVRR